MTWWAQATLDWTAGEPRRALELLAHAYDEPAAIETIARASHIAWRAPALEATTIEIWRGVLDQAVHGGLLYNLLVRVLADRSVDVFHHLLRDLLHGGRLEAIEDDPAGELQAVTDPRSGWLRSYDIEQVFANGRRRTALIEVDGVALGTGFLIGPDLLMTAAHVVGRECPPPETRQVVAVFERNAAPAAPAEAGVRVRAKKFIVGQPPTLAEREARYGDWNAPPRFLDYAVYELEWKIGNDTTDDDVLRRPRGSYALSADSYDFAAGGDLTIHMYPLGGPQVVCPVKGATQPSPSGTRVRYTGNTEPGSSGAGCVDRRGRLVAMHHFAARSLNQGVPIAAIARDIIAQGYGKLLEAPPPAPWSPPPRSTPFSTLAFGRKPFVNREKLRAQVAQMLGDASRGDGNGVARESGRVLVIEGGARLGRTYSYQLLAYVAAECHRDPELHALAARGVMPHKLDLERYTTAPIEGLCHRLIGDILGLLGVVTPGGDGLAQAARSFANLSSWLSTRLQMDGVLHWLFIDNIDRFPLERDGVKDLLASLVDMVEDDYAIPLRLVLVLGDKAPQLQRELARWASRETLTSITSTEAALWLTRSLASRGVAVDDAIVRDRVAALHPGVPAPSPETLALALADALDELAGRAP